MVLRRRTQATPLESIPASRFDTWATQDVYTALESQIMDLQRALDDYSRADEPSMVLSLMDIKIRTATEALGVLRKRLAVANDKRN